MTNTSFDPSLAEYSGRYEETQAYSSRFVSFARSLAEGWVHRYDLVDKTVLEIGCGKGEFLVMMAEAGIGHGIGMDPGVHPERIEAMQDRLEWVPDLFVAGTSIHGADAIVCRHTLEHIGPVGEFLTAVRTAIGPALDTVVLFELPDTRRILKEVAFWDIYYEHCSYFTEGSLARLFERSGFEVLNLAHAFEGQYLLIEAKPVTGGRTPRVWPSDPVDDVKRDIEHFADVYGETVSRWVEELRARNRAGGTTVVWGASSKAVSFLAEVGDFVTAAVDVNPNKHGMFVAGTGHRIVAPQDLGEIAPDLVVVMNPIYREEIAQDLLRLGIDAELVSL